MSKRRLNAVACAVALALVIPAIGMAQENPNSYTIDGPSSAVRCSRILVTVTPSYGGALWDTISWSGLTLVSGEVEIGWNGQKEYAAGFGSWNLDTWHNGALWFCNSCPRGPAKLIFDVIGNPGAGNATVSVRYGWDNYGGTPYGTDLKIDIAPNSGNTISVIGPTVMPADGTTTFGLSGTCKDPSCHFLPGVSVTVSTSLGLIRKAGQPDGQSAVVTADSVGQFSGIQLVASTTPGKAVITATAEGASGTTEVNMSGLTVEAEPDRIPADGTTVTVVSAKVTPAREGLTISFSTDKGTLSESTAVTDATGTAYVTLKSDSTPGTATVSASYLESAFTISGSTQVPFEGLTIQLSSGSVDYKSVAGKGGGTPLVAQAGVTQAGVATTGPVATRFGRTLVHVSLALRRGQAGSSAEVGGKVINLKSDQKDQAGSQYVSFWTHEQGYAEATTVTTDGSGNAAFDVAIDDVWRAPVAIPDVFVVGELAEDASIKSDPFKIRVRNNRDEDLLPLFRTTPLVGSGPVYTNATLKTLLEPYNAWLPGIQNDGVASNAFAGVGEFRQEAIGYTAPYYQQKVLTWLHRLQWGPLLPPPNTSEDQRWMLNGLDWAPLFVQGGTHLAVVVYPRTGGGGSASEWGNATEARILDPWIWQTPTAYDWPGWKSALGDADLERLGQGVKYQTHEYTAGQFGGTASASYHYPPNDGYLTSQGYYYDSMEDVPAPFDPAQQNTWADSLVEYYRMLLHCPVFITVTDALGRRSGYAPPPAAEPLVDEIPGVLRETVAQPDGTLGWSFVLPPGTFTFAIEAYGDGPMTLSLLDPAGGRIVKYDTTVAAGDTATLAYDPQAQSPAALVFTGGRTVQGVSGPVLAPGVQPKEGKATGGTAITVTGVDVSPGATVALGGAAATAVTIANGTTLTAVTGKAVRVGPVDVVVTNPGAAPVTLAKAFTYETAGNLVDVNADGFSDIVFYRPDTGRWAMTTADGHGGFAATLGQWSAGWTIKPGDFNGDGATDLFFYNGATGAWYVGLNDGQGQYTYLPGTWAAGWAPVVLDLTGDGRADVFVYNKITGAWYQCVTTGPGTFAYHGGQWSPQWEVIPADLDGDGVGDLFVYNAATGAWFRCVSDGVGGFTYVPGQWSPGWEIVAGDFDGDGVGDLLTYSSETGAWYRCRNTGSAFEYTPGQWSAGWQLHVGDFSGDGRADVLVYNPETGAWYECLEDGAGGFAYHGGSWSPDWQVHVMELNGDGQSDVLVYNAETGAYYQCVTTGPGTFAYTAGQWDAGWTLITGVGR